MSILNYQKAYQQLTTNLKKLYDGIEANKIADMVLEYITQQIRIERLIHQKNELTTIQLQQFESIQKQLLTAKPIQYIIEEAWFYKRKFWVNKHVLIPRPETEELVGLMLRNIKQNVSVIDVGTGSGCIPITLKKESPNWNIISVDINEDALQVAQKNANNLQVDIDFKQLNFLDETTWKSLGIFDVIVSNPPYIKLSEQASMHKNVVEFEPLVALFVEDDDALIFYKKIIAFAKNHLAKNGKIFVEINESLGVQTLQLFIDAGFTTSLIKDSQEKERMIMACSN